MALDGIERAELAARVHAFYDSGRHCLIEVDEGGALEPRLILVRGAAVGDVVAKVEDLLLGNPAVRVTACDTRTLRRMPTPAPLLCGGPRAVALPQA